MGSVFINPIEIEIIRFIITYPWNTSINKYAGIIASLSLYPNRFIGGSKSFKKSSMKVKLGNRSAIVYIGSHNSHYVKIKGQMIPKKEAIKLCNSKK